MPVQNSPRALTFDDLEVGMHLRATGIPTPGNWDFVVRGKLEEDVAIERADGSDPCLRFFGRLAVTNLEFIQIEAPTTDPITIICNLMNALDAIPLEKNNAEHAPLLKAKQEAQAYLDSQAPKVHKA